MNPTRQWLLNTVARLNREMRTTADRDVRFETLEKLALLSEVAQTLIDFEAKLMTDLDVD